LGTMLLRVGWLSTILSETTSGLVPRDCFAKAETMMPAGTAIRRTA